MIVTNGVKARAAVERIIARTTLEVVISGATGQRVGPAVAGERIVVIRAHDVLDIEHDVRTVAAGCGASCQVHVHSTAGVVVVDGVDSRAAVERVVSGAAFKLIVARSTGEEIAAAITSQRVSMA